MELGKMEREDPYELMHRDQLFLKKYCGIGLYSSKMRYVNDYFDYIAPRINAKDDADSLSV